ncbi:MAG: gene transfer agent family protein [Devosia sp.]
MSRDGGITLDWADGEHRFRLAWGELRQLQEACDAGPFVILQRLQLGSWKLGDISETIRLGLIGGGATPERALQLVRDYVEARPPLENVKLALGVLAAAVIGPEDERLGEDDAATDQKA